jgi:hypothetical protein
MVFRFTHHISFVYCIWDRVPRNKKNICTKLTATAAERSRPRHPADQHNELREHELVLVALEGHVNMNCVRCRLIGTAKGRGGEDVAAARTVDLTVITSR